MTVYGVFKNTFLSRNIYRVIPELNFCHGIQLLSTKPIKTNGNVLRSFITFLRKTECTILCFSFQNRAAFFFPNMFLFSVSFFLFKKKNADFYVSPHCEFQTFFRSF